MSFVYTAAMDKKRWRLLFFCILLLCGKHRSAFSFHSELVVFDQFDLSDNGFSVNASGAPDRNVLPRMLIAGSQALLSNAVLMSFNTVVHQTTGTFPWATPTPASIRMNLTEPWHWDGDGFLVNQVGHPIQGAMYFGAGRANAFTFYQSALFSVFGSLTWEALFENQQASINDVFTTVPASLSAGEMFYRLYLEAVHAGVPAAVAFFINPIVGFHRLVSGWEPPDYGRNMYQFRVFLGTGHAQTDLSLTGTNQRLSPFQGFFADAGFSIIYGNPFVQGSRVPFDHFRFDLSVGINPDNFVDIRFMSDGYLFSFSPFLTNTASNMSTGLSLHMDAVTMGRPDGIYAAAINMYSNALNWAVKYQRFFSAADFQVKAHAGVTFFGASRFYCPDTMADRNNFGGGLNGKLFFNLNHNRFGSLEMSVFGYTLHTFPGVSSAPGGTVFWLFNDVAYLFHFTQNLSLGAAHSFALEREEFDTSPNTRKTNRALRFFAAWNF